MAMLNFPLLLLSHYLLCCLIFFILFFLRNHIHFLSVFFDEYKIYKHLFETDYLFLLLFFFHAAT